MLGTHTILGCACSEPKSTASTNRCTKEAPRRRCLTTDLSTTIDNTRSLPHFCADMHCCRDVRVELRSGSQINKISESMADSLGVNIVIDDYGYDEYVVGMCGSDYDYECDDRSISVPEMSERMTDVVGLTSFTLRYHGMELWFDGLVMKDESMNVSIIAGTPFMEVNDISVKPSKGQVMFSNGTTYMYNGNDLDLSSSQPECSHTLPAAVSFTIFTHDN